MHRFPLNSVLVQLLVSKNVETEVVPLLNYITDILMHLLLIKLLDVSERFRFTSDGRRRLRKSSYSLRSYISKWKGYLL